MRIYYLSDSLQGALWGGLSALGIMFWISLGQEYAIGTGEIDYPQKPVRTDGCDFNITTIWANNRTLTEPIEG